ncbi:hypothetical protein ACWM9A_14545 [Acetobacter pasteurianus]
MTQLVKTIHINPLSIYAAFGSKEELFARQLNCMLYPMETQHGTSRAKGEMS